VGFLGNAARPSTLWRTHGVIARGCLPAGQFSDKRGFDPQEFGLRKFAAEQLPAKMAATPVHANIGGRWRHLVLRRILAGANNDSIINPL
jgi:hypothetical protein